MSIRTIKSQVKAGFRRAGALLLGFAWLGLVFGGLAIAFTPSPHPPVVGWLLLIAAALVLIAIMDRWVGVFSALLAYGIIGGIVTIVSGHAVNHPEVPVPRLYAVIMTLLIAGSAVVSFTFTKRKLGLPDRIALFAFVFCFFWTPMVSHLTLVPLGIGFSCLVGAWAYDRLRRRRGHSRGSGTTRRQEELSSFHGTSTE